MPKAKKSVLIEAVRREPKNTAKHSRGRGGSTVHTGHRSTFPDGRKPGFPSERVVTLPYVDSGQFSSGTTTVSKNQFRMNSVFDPDYTATGHQPYGFDQWKVLYNHYVVEACTAEVVLTTTATGTVAPVLFGMYVSDDFTVQNQSYQLIEAGSAWDMSSIRSSGPKTLKVHLDVSKFLNRRNLAADPDLRTSTSTNPIEQIYLTLWTQSTDLTNAMATSYNLTLNFRVRFMEPIDVTESFFNIPPRPSHVFRKYVPASHRENGFVRVEHEEDEGTGSHKSCTSCTVCETAS